MAAITTDYAITPWTQSANCTATQLSPRNNGASDWCTVETLVPGESEMFEIMRVYHQSASPPATLGIMAKLSYSQPDKNMSDNTIKVEVPIP